MVVIVFPFAAINPFEIFKEAFPQLVLTGLKTWACHDPGSWKNECAVRTGHSHASFSRFLSCQRWCNVVGSSPLPLTQLSCLSYTFYGLHERMTMTSVTDPSRAATQKPFSPSWSKKGQRGQVSQSGEWGSPAWQSETHLKQTLSILALLIHSLRKAQETRSPQISWYREAGDTFEAC